jgi:sugar phosphate isomerase/epimerase
MKKISRRAFLANTCLGVGGTVAMMQLPGFLKAGGTPAFNDIPIGFQSYTIREMLGKDFAGTLKKMADFGYKTIEMCSPAGYANGGFGFLVNTKATDIKRTINDAGLECPSCHFGFGEFGDKLDERITFARELGLTHMVCSSFGLPKTATLKDFTDAAVKLNSSAEKIKSAGMETGYHNHETEFATLDGSLIYDALMGAFNPALVKMQFQTEVINIGYKAADYFKKYPGRFISAHLSDWTADKKEVPVGEGVIAWKEFFETAKTGGVKHLFVEMGFDTFKNSAAYIKAL